MVIGVILICFYTIGGFIVAVALNDDDKYAMCVYGIVDREAENCRISVMLKVNAAAGLVYGLSLVTGCGFAAVPHGS